LSYPMAAKKTVPEKVNLADLNFAPYNPRSMPAKEREALEANIEEHGVITSLVVQKKGRTVIGGHQRIRAIRAVCKRRKWTVPSEVWAYVLDVDDRTAKRLNIALNNVHGEFDAHMLGEVLRSINDEAPLVERETLALAFDLKQLDGLLKVGEVPDLSAASTGPGTQSRSIAKTPTLSIEFATEQERDKARDILAEMIRARKDAKPGTFVLAALVIYRPGP
jgi:ParB-like chromosome segregation protein Spo0J